jgi:hypothetical protein
MATFVWLCSYAPQAGRALQPLPPPALATGLRSADEEYETFLQLSRAGGLTRIPALEKGKKGAAAHMPTDKWFLDELDLRKLHHGRPGPGHDLHTVSRCRALALLRVVPGRVWDGPLNWSRRLQLQREQLSMPEDAYSINVESVMPLEVPQNVYLCDRPTRQQRGHVRLLIDHPYMVFRPVEGAIDYSARFRSTGSGGGAPCAPPQKASDVCESALGIMVADPFAHLIQAGKWTELLALGRWKPLWPEAPRFPSCEWVAARSGSFALILG